MNSGLVTQRLGILRHVIFSALRWLWGELKANSGRDYGMIADLSAFGPDGNAELTKEIEAIVGRELNRIEP
jgi:hypothetical protein